jgi:asparagine synthase (glutamine-hydrolysing)
MCGISGIISREGFAPELLATMTSAIRHRGPDDEGYFLVGDDGIPFPCGGKDTVRSLGLPDIASLNGRKLHVGLGHRRLSILDLSDAGHQPMSSPDGRYWITYNGEIYNYIELRQELEKAGHRFRSATDTEVILHAYTKWGDDCLHHFNGMWAFSIWDAARDHLFAARDRFGIKPLYYYTADGLLLFASEIKSLLAAGIPREVNWQAFADYLVFLYTTGDKTFFRNVRQLEPGHFLRYSMAEGLETRQYWDLKITEDVRDSKNDVAARCRELLDSSVKLRLRSDVRVGCYLSGGLDSSAVATLAATNSNSKIAAFTAAFSEGGIYDETPYARAVAKRSGLEAVELFPNMSDFWETLPKVIYHLDQPFEGPQVFPKFMISELASRHVKVCLGGQGGDEVFVGYPRYLMAFLEAEISGPKWWRKGGEMVGWLRVTSPRSKMRFMADCLQRKSLADRFLHFATVNRLSRSHGPVGKMLAEMAPDYSPYDYYFAQLGDCRSLGGLQRYEQKTFLQGLLHVEDRVSMAWGLESRLPLLDYRISEYLFSLAPDIRTDGYRLKGALRNSMRDILPDMVIGRKDKLGFPTPFRSWVKSGLAVNIRDLMMNSTLVSNGLLREDDVEPFLDGKSLDDMRGLTLWALTAFEVWHSVFFDNKFPSLRS